MKPFTFKKSEKAQVLVIVGLTFVMLTSIIGLAIDMGYMYVSYARLHRAADAAALAGSGEFKRNYTNERLQGAATQVLYTNLNGQDTTDSTVFPDPLIETCDTVAEKAHADISDPAQLQALVDLEHAAHPGKEVCTKPLKKIVRVTVKQNVNTFFLAIVGIHSYQIQAESLSEAATVDVMLAIDTSESMTKGWNPNSPIQGDDADPSQCNIYNSCSPFIDVKNAAAQFMDNLYFPYDRAGILTFAKDAEMILPLSDNSIEIEAAIDSLKVFEANQGCPYRFEDRLGTGQPRDTFSAISGDVVNPCRLYHDGASGLGYTPNEFVAFDCPSFYGPTPDAAACGSTNTSDGIALGGAILTGDYSSPIAAGFPTPADGWPEKRDDSLWVLLLLTDGAANSGHDSIGSRLCPNEENTYAWFADHPQCRDADTLTRHCWSLTETNGHDDCMAATFPSGTSSDVNQDLYDGDDRARDMFDLVSRNNTLIFTIGMGAQTKRADNPRYDVNGIAPGITLLQYGAYGTTYDKIPFSNALKGLYYYGNDASQLTLIFLKIANNLATRINQ
jgi:hypothetical protein